MTLANRMNNLIGGVGSAINVGVRNIKSSFGKKKPTSGLLKNVANIKPTVNARNQALQDIEKLTQ